jgi:hypothetical protein
MDTMCHTPKSSSSASSIRVHGMLWPRFLLREEEVPRTSIGLSSKKSKQVNTKVMPHKKAAAIPTGGKRTTSPRKMSERVVRQVQEHIHELECKGSRILPTSFTPLADHHHHVTSSCSSPLSSRTTTNGGFPPSSTTNSLCDSLPVLVPEQHSYYWNRPKETGRPAKVMSGQIWTRVIPIEPSKTVQRPQHVKISSHKHVTLLGSAGSSRG